MTRGVPSMATRFSATTRPILFCSGDTQRLNSSSRTWFGLTATTIWGRSTEAGIAIGPTATDRSDDGAAGPGTALSVKNCDEGGRAAGDHEREGAEDRDEGEAAHHLPRISESGWRSR